MQGKVGFIGLGNMGEPMAANLARAGFEMVVYDLRSEPLERLHELGASVADSPRELAASCELVSVMVVDDQQVREVVTGADGVLEALQGGATLIVHSTVSPETCRELAKRAAEQQIELLDAPVSGGAGRARDATLSMMVGGSPERFERTRPVLEAVASHLFHMGDVGAGVTTKLANNLVGIANGRILEEGLALARLSGIDEARMLEVINVSSGQSFVSQTRDAMRAEASKHTGGRAGLRRIMSKDISLAVTLGRDVEARIPLGERLAELLAPRN